MDRPGTRDCRILDDGIWLSRDIIESMRTIYHDKEQFAEHKPRALYQGKRELMDDLLRFISEGKVTK